MRDLPFDGAALHEMQREIGRLAGSGSGEIDRLGPHRAGARPRRAQAVHAAAQVRELEGSVALIRRGRDPSLRQRFVRRQREGEELRRGVGLGEDQRALDRAAVAVDDAAPDGDPALERHVQDDRRSARGEIGVLARPQSVDRERGALESVRVGATHFGKSLAPQERHDEGVGLLGARGHGHRAAQGGRRRGSRRRRGRFDAFRRAGALRRRLRGSLERAVEDERAAAQPQLAPRDELGPRIDVRDAGTRAQERARRRRAAQVEARDLDRAGVEPESAVARRDAPKGSGRAALERDAAALEGDGKTAVAGRVQREARARLRRETAVGAEMHLRRDPLRRRELERRVREIEAAPALVVGERAPRAVESFAHRRPARGEEAFDAGRARRTSEAAPTDDRRSDREQDGGRRAPQRRAAGPGDPQRELALEARAERRIGVDGCVGAREERSEVPLEDVRVERHRNPQRLDRLVALAAVARDFGDGPALHVLLDERLGVLRGQRRERRPHEVARLGALEHVIGERLARDLREDRVDLGIGFGEGILERSRPAHPARVADLDLGDAAQPGVEARPAVAPAHPLESDEEGVLDEVLDAVRIPSEAPVDELDEGVEGLLEKGLRRLALAGEDPIAEKYVSGVRIRVDHARAGLVEIGNKTPRTFRRIPASTAPGES